MFNLIKREGSALLKVRPDVDRIVGLTGTFLERLDGSVGGVRL